MNKLKKIISVVLILGLLSAIIVPAQANTIQPRWTHVDELYAALKIDTTLGIATCEGSITAQDDLPVKVIVYLQQYNNGRWVTLKTWQAEDSEYVYKSGSYAIYSGYKYRTYVEGFVYDSNGNMIEATSLAQEKTY